MKAMIVAHTHWDREWYEPFQSFRVRLVHLVDDLLDLLEHDLPIGTLRLLASERSAGRTLEVGGR